MSSKSFYEGLYDYETTLDLETIEALANCVLRNLSREELRETIKGRKIEKALDVGCGIGFNLVILLSHAKIDYTIGIDIASGAVRVAKKRLAKRGARNKTDFIISDARFLPFKKDTFDLVTCTEVLEHVANDTMAVSELSRITTKTGKIFLSVPSERSTFKKYVTKSRETSQSFVGTVNRSYFGLQTGGDLRGYQIEDIKESLNQRKLKVTRLWYNGRFFYSLTLKLNFLILRLGRKLLKLGGEHRDVIREIIHENGNMQRIRRLLSLYSKTIIPLSNAILSLDLLLLRFDYGGNLTIEAQHRN